MDVVINSMVDIKVYSSKHLPWQNINSVTTTFPRDILKNLFSFLIEETQFQTKSAHTFAISRLFDK